MDLNEVLALALAARRITEEAITTYKKLREIAEQEGATPEQLKELDGKLTDAIGRREAELRQT